MGVRATPDRDHLLGALRADLVGPFYPPDWEGPTNELLPLPPSRWYLTGFLTPIGDRETYDPTEDDELAAGADEETEDAAGSELT